MITKREYLILITLLCILSQLLLSCGKEKHVTGKVVNEAHQPLSDVDVIIENSTFTAKTHKDGSYSLDYAPGEFKVIFSKTGYIGDALALKIAEKVPFPAKTIRLLKILKEQGIFALTDSGYKKIEQVPVNETRHEMNDMFIIRTHLIFKPKGNPTVIRVKQSDCLFMDSDIGDQVLVRLNQNKEIGTLVIGGFGVVEKTSIQYINENYRQPVNGLYERHVNLSPGLYAFVPTVATSPFHKVPGKTCYYFELVIEQEQAIK
ncbi:MAG: hypothetical protein DKINENOH_01143 [bacterium]|nr:hypothetical protein [bacterium]